MKFNLKAGEYLWGFTSEFPNRVNQVVVPRYDTKWSFDVKHAGRPIRKIMLMPESHDREVEIITGFDGMLMTHTLVVNGVVEGRPHRMSGLYWGRIMAVATGMDDVNQVELIGEAVDDRLLAKVPSEWFLGLEGVPYIIREDLNPKTGVRRTWPWAIANIRMYLRAAVIQDSVGINLFRSPGWTCMSRNPPGEGGVIYWRFRDGVLDDKEEVSEKSRCMICDMFARIAAGK